MVSPFRKHLKHTYAMSAMSCYLSAKQYISDKLISVDISIHLMQWVSQSSPLNYISVCNFATVKNLGHLFRLIWVLLAN